MRDAYLVTVAPLVDLVVDWAIHGSQTHVF